MSKELGKIQSIKLGFGGYQDAMFGVSVGLGGEGWGCGDFKGTWATWSKDCKWTEASQGEHFAHAVRWVRDLCQEAKVETMDKLKGVPIEATFDGSQKLVSWRVLKEVL